VAQDVLFEMKFSWILTCVVQNNVMAQSLKCGEKTTILDIAVIVVRP